uniref:Replication-associated protein ORF2/G2P domain-containing protein n=2 Tax=cellular organisms TaxID=131567 RepID=A0A7C3YGF3_9EURY
MIHLTHAKLKLPSNASSQPKHPKPKSPRNTPIHPSRYRAKRILETKRRLKQEDWEELYDYFNEYVEDVSNRVIVLKLFDEKEFLFIRYQHRFTKKRLKEVLKRFKEAWKKASSEHNVGVFITLTMDPSKHSNLMEALINISKSFNRFMSYLRKFFGFRPSYIKVLEAQDSGNPHYHVVFFGVERIMDHYELTEVLERLGFGQIHYEYKIVKDKSGKWVWANPKVRRTMRKDVQDYLVKYMTESFCSVLGWSSKKQSESRQPKQATLDDFPKQDLAKFKISYYFASNKRFFTCSMQFLTKTERKYVSGWIFVGSWYWHDVPDWILDATGAIIVPDNHSGWRILPVE